MTSTQHTAAVARAHPRVYSYDTGMVPVHTIKNIYIRTGDTLHAVSEKGVTLCYTRYQILTAVAFYE